MKTGYAKFFSEAKKARGLSEPGTPSVKRVPTKGNVTKRPRRKTAFPIGLILTLGVGLVLAVSASQYQSEVLSIFENFEIGLFSLADAEDKPAVDAKKKDEASAPQEATKEAEHANDPEYLKKLVERKKELDVREAEISKIEEELRLQRETLDSKIKELDKIRAQIGEILKEKVEVDSERVDKLVEFYSNMKPQQAAKIMETLNEDLAVETLGRMKKKNAADIMNLLEAKKAQSISEKFAGYRRK